MITVTINLSQAELLRLRRHIQIDDAIDSADPTNILDILARRITATADQDNGRRREIADAVDDMQRPAARWTDV